jgi:hypothetical protein
MSLVSRLVLLLLASPLAIFLGHVASYRGSRAIGRVPTAHTSAFAGIGFSFVIVLTLALTMAWTEARASLTMLLGVAVYVTATYAALSVLYVDIVNIAETSLHMHLLLEVSWNDRLSLERLIDRYSPSHMVGERLERLTAMGQIRREGDRYYLGANRTALLIANCVDAWRRVLGMPTRP